MGGGGMFTLFLASAVAGGPQPTLAERGAAHKRSVHVHRNDPVTVDAKLDLGERAFNSLAVQDEDAARKLREGVCDARVPRGFWRKFIEGELNLRYSDHQRVKVRRALLFLDEPKRTAGCNPDSYRHAGLAATGLVPHKRRCHESQARGWA